ncbi:DUF6214 family protein, partial [Streptomyces sp. NPDC055078]
MQETTFLNANDQYDANQALPYPPVWEIQGHGTVTTTEPPAGGGTSASAWCDVRFTFADGARLDVLAVVDDGGIAIEDLRADPPLPLRLFERVLADRIEEPLEDACRTAVPRPVADVADVPDATDAVNAVNATDGPDAV